MHNSTNTSVLFSRIDTPAIIEGCSDIRFGGGRGSSGLNGTTSGSGSNGSELIVHDFDAPGGVASAMEQKHFAIIADQEAALLIQDLQDLPATVEGRHTVIGVLRRFNIPCDDNENTS